MKKCNILERNCENCACRYYEAWENSIFMCEGWERAVSQEEENAAIKCPRYVQISLESEVRMRINLFNKNYEDAVKDIKELEEQLGYTWEDVLQEEEERRKEEEAKRMKMLLMAEDELPFF